MSFPKDKTKNELDLIKNNFFILVDAFDQINLDFQDQLKLDSPFFKELSSIWAEQLDSAIHALPKFNWEE